MKKILDFIRKYKELLKIILFILFITGVVLVFITFIYTPTVVVGDSMYPALNEGDILLIKPINGKYQKIERFDIIMFPYKYNTKTNVIKRVIGMPGDKIEIKDNIIYINDEKLDEYYGYYDDKSENRYSDVKAVSLAYDEYFVIGDNRNVSEDSRNDEIGVIKQDTITGIAVFRIWSFNSIGSLENQ